jgi:hypothetical protein
MLDCIITIRGDGEGKYGNIKEDKTGPLHDFLSFRKVYFKAIRDHVQKCDECKIEDIFVAYKNRVILNQDESGENEYGTTSKTLLEHVTALEKILRKSGKTYDKELVNELFLRSYRVDMILSRIPECSYMELLWCYRFHDSHNNRRALELLHHRVFSVIHQIVQGSKDPQDEETLKSLIEVAEIMTS